MRLNQRTHSRSFTAAGIESLRNDSSFSPLFFSVRPENHPTASVDVCGWKRIGARRSAQLKRERGQPNKELTGVKSRTTSRLLRTSPSMSTRSQAWTCGDSEPGFSLPCFPPVVVTASATPKREGRTGQGKRQGLTTAESRPTADPEVNEDTACFIFCLIATVTRPWLLVQEASTSTRRHSVSVLIVWKHIFLGRERYDFLLPGPFAVRQEFGFRCISRKILL